MQVSRVTFTWTAAAVCVAGGLQGVAEETLAAAGGVTSVAGAEASLVAGDPSGVAAAADVMAAAVVAAGARPLPALPMPTLPSPQSSQRGRD